MCKQTYTTVFYTCGDSEEQDAFFETCGNQTAPNHEVKRIPLGSTRKNEKCGKYGCRNP
jgi:hypothetical protein